MARPVDRPHAGLFSTGAYTKSWYPRNPYYATKAGSNYLFHPGNVFTDAAIRSGVVQQASYSQVPPEKKPGLGSYYQSASPTRRAQTTPFDIFGNLKRQQGDIVLGLVSMGGYQFPGQAFAPDRAKGGAFIPNQLAMFLASQGKGGTPWVLPTARDRIAKIAPSTGWMSTLTQSTSSIKEPGGKGQSSIDTTLERYSTQETRAGTRFWDTDEKLDPKTGKMSRSWAGYKELQPHSVDHHYKKDLAVMFQYEDTNKGTARRSIRTIL